MKRILVALPLAALMVLAAGAAAHAQSDEALSVKIPFAFKIGEKSMPAGAYEIELSRVTKEVVFRPNGAKKEPEQMTQGKILTRLGSVGPGQALIFDQRSDGNLLSEVWLKRDGFLIQGDFGDIDHQHRLVKAASKPVAPASVKK